MCLAIPGRVVEWRSRDPLFARALVEFGGIRKECHMACVEEAEIGDYVLVHAGLAICKVDEAEALQTLAELQALGESEFATEESP